MFKKIQYNILVYVCSLLLASAVALSSAVAATPKKVLVITTIKPLAIIVQSALGDQAQVEYLQSAVQSAHEVSLPISALRKIDQADLVVWVGESFEARIAKSIALLPQDKVLTLMQLPLQKPAINEPAGLEDASAADSQSSLDHHHQHLNFDPHVWLNPANANLIAARIQQHLGVPQKSIISNQQIAELADQLVAARDKYYLVHHDALGHFSSAFGLQPGLAIRSSSGSSQGAKSHYLLRQAAQTVGASCIFVEPQYADRDARVLARERSLPLIELDIQGIQQPLTGDAYANFMITLVSRFNSCF